MNLNTEASCASAPCATVTASHHRSLSYDTETGFYYLQSRYYDPVTCRFVNADAPELSEMTAYNVGDSNMFAYCGNNPVMREDANGEFWDTVLDVVSIATDIIDIAANPANPWAWGALAADVASLLLPGVTGGGAVVRFVANSDVVLDAAKYADDIIDASKAVSVNPGIGRQIHSTYNPIQNTSTDYLINQPLKRFSSRLRPDAVDFQNRIIYELKPYNRRSFTRAVRQTNKYAKTMGGKWTIVIDLYIKGK